MFIIDWEEFGVKKGDLKAKENLPIVNCENTEKFVKMLIEIKEENIFNQTVKLGSEGGRGFLKVAELNFNILNVLKLKSVVQNIVKEINILSYFRSV